MPHITQRTTTVGSMNRHGSFQLPRITCYNFYELTDFEEHSCLKDRDETTSF